METIVCKFGGTSVADADAIKRVKSIAEADESRRFIVVSAPGKRFAGDTKVTDLFYAAVKAAKENGRAEFEKVFSVIFARFRAIVAALFPYSSFPGKILAELNAIGRRVYEEKDEDFAASRGEYLTGKILAEFLGCAFIDAEELILFTDGGAIDDRTYEIARSRLKGEMRAVIPGFYGKNADGKVRTFPRGGGDITGAAIASAVRAALYENWTDVSGCYACDPQIVPFPKKIARLSYAEMRTLSLFGAGVLHGDAVFPLRKANIPVFIKNTFCPEAKGTVISANSPACGVKGITGTARFRGAATVAIVGDGVRGNSRIVEKIFASLAKARIDVLFFDETRAEAGVLVGTREKDLERAIRVLYKAFFRQ